MTDASIPLQTQTPAPYDPLQQYGRVLALQGAMQGQQVQAAQLTGLNQENQQRQIQMDNMQKLNKLYMGSLNGDGTVDSGKLSTAMAANGLGSQIPTVLKGVTDYQKSLSDLAETRGKVWQQQTDAMGALGNTLKSAKYDPQLFLTKAQMALDAKAVDPSQVAKQIQSVQQALTADPTGAQARQVVRDLSENAIQMSAKQQELINQSKTAQGSADRGTAALQDAQRAQAAADLKTAAAKLGSATNAADYTRAYDALTPDQQKQFPDPKAFDPKATPQTALRVGMSPGEIASDARSNTRQTDLDDYRRQVLDLRAQLLAEREARMQQLGGTGSGGGPTPNAQGVQNRFNAKEIDGARKQLDQIHLQRSAIGNALAVQNGQTYVDPRTGKPSTQPMDDGIRAALTSQFQDLSNAGQRIMQTYGGAASNGRIGANEYQSGAPQPAQTPQTQPAAQAPRPQTPATQQQQPGAQDPTMSVKLPNGQYLSGPKSKITAYLKAKGYSLQGQ